MARAGAPPGLLPENDDQQVPSVCDEMIKDFAHRIAPAMVAAEPPR